MTAAARKKPRRDEDKLQKAVCQLLRIYEHQGHLTWFAIPNGGYRRPAEARIMKSLGTRAGIPDLCIVAGGAAYFLELKTPAGRLTPNQKEKIQVLSNNGAHCAVIRSIDEATENLRAWGIIPR